MLALRLLAFLSAEVGVIDWTDVLKVQPKFGACWKRVNPSLPKKLLRMPFDANTNYRMIIDPQPRHESHFELATKFRLWKIIPHPTGLSFSWLRGSLLTAMG